MVRPLLVTCSIRINLACRLKSCPGSLKCLSKGHPFWLFTSCLWVLTLKLAGGSLLPTYWDLAHRVQWAKYIRFFLQQLRLFSMDRTSPVTWLENVLVDRMCLQHSFLLEVRQALHPGSLVRFLGKIFLPRERWCCPISSLRFLFRR